MLPSDAGMPRREADCRGEGGEMRKDAKVRGPKKRTKSKVRGRKAEIERG